MVQPLDYQVLIKPEPITEVKLNSGLIITNPRLKTRKGQVLDVGKDVTELKKGDIVEFSVANNAEIEGMFIVDCSEKNSRVLFKYN